MEALFPVLFIGFLILIVVGGYFAYQAQKKRREALFQIAQEFGFEYLPDGIPAKPTSGFWESLTSAFETSPERHFMARFESFSPFGQGESQDISNLLVGRHKDLDWYIFDYSYKTSSTDSNGNRSETTHTYGIVSVRTNLFFPNLQLAPENAFHRIGSKLGLKEFTFESEQFNRKYFIRGDDPKAAHDFIHPQSMDLLLALPSRHWQMRGNYLMIHQSGLYKPEQIREIMQETERFLASIPEYVRQDRSFTANWQHPLDG